MSTSILIDPVQRAKEDEIRKARAEAQKDNLEQEIAAKEAKIPDKFKGKSLEDVVESYTNLEKELGRKTNELSQAKSMIDQLVPLELGVKQAKEQEPEPISSDDLFNDPEKAITRVVEANPAVQRLNARADVLERNIQVEDFKKSNPSYSSDLENPDFVEWIKKSPVRLGLANKADQYDFNAASELWSLWGEYKSIRSEANLTRKAEKEVERERKELAGTLESGTGNTVETKEVLSRAEIVDLKKRAMQGDRNARTIVEDPAWRAKVNLAYLEKRVQ